LPATLKLDAPTAFTGPIQGIVIGDAIDLAGITASSATYSGSTLTINETNGQHLTYNNVSGSVAGDTVTVASDNEGGERPSGLKEMENATATSSETRSGRRGISGKTFHAEGHSNQYCDFWRPTFLRSLSIRALDGLTSECKN
jgi:hypothetical protein